MLKLIQFAFSQSIYVSNNHLMLVSLSADCRRRCKLSSWRKQMLWSSASTLTTNCDSFWSSALLADTGIAPKTKVHKFSLTTTHIGLHRVGQKVRPQTNVHNSVRWSRFTIFLLEKFFDKFAVNLLLQIPPLLAYVKPVNYSPPPVDPEVILLLGPL